ncbi:LemA family protein [Sporosarcina sp. FSL K6-3457]|uniref:LemA family protein n=1 Tax=Sporosarcina sp. FSL K6-3457 TaxID=2978204 RepID=UPI0030F4FE71
MAIVWIAVAVLVIYIILLYNRLLAMRNWIKESFAEIEVYLQNRYDTLIKVAETVVGYAKYEKNTLKEITRIREGLNDRTPSEKLQKFDELNEKLEGFRVHVEAYPELKASKNFLHLQQTANDLEEKLSAARRTYNSNVIAFNTSIGTFPALLFAQVLGFKAYPVYEVPQAKKEDVSMKQMLNG